MKNPQAEANKRYRNKHREKYNAWRREYYKIHREQMIAKSKKWRKKNRDKCNAYAKEYYKTHREQIIAKVMAWKRKHKNPELLKNGI